MKILITDVINDKGLIEKKIFGKKYSVKICGAKKNIEIPDKLLSEADAILFYDLINVDKNFLSKLKKCKALVRVGVGLDNVDLKFAKEIGIPVITEIMEEKYIDLVAEVTDIIQIGSRNMQNFPFLTACAKTQKPIMLKNFP